MRRFPLRWRSALARWGPVLFNLYGTSEAGLSTIATPRDLAVSPSTIGRPMWGAELQITDDRGRLAAAGEAGALSIRNPASIAPDTWIATGDLASCDHAGRLFLHGCADDMIVSGGENVTPWAVECVLREHPAVAEAIAVGVPDVEFGQRLVASIVLRTGVPNPPTALDVAAWLGARVARHQRPRAIIIRESMPLTAIGKVDRRALAAEYS